MFKKTRTVNPPMFAHMHSPSHRSFIASTPAVDVHTTSTIIVLCSDDFFSLSRPLHMPLHDFFYSYKLWKKKVRKVMSFAAADEIVPPLSTRRKEQEQNKKMVHVNIHNWANSATRQPWTVFTCVTCYGKCVAGAGATAAAAAGVFLACKTNAEHDLNLNRSVHTRGAKLR